MDHGEATSKEHHDELMIDRAAVCLVYTYHLDGSLTFKHKGDKIVILYLVAISCINLRPSKHIYEIIRLVSTWV
jgi:hypothetical protein